MNEQKFSGKSAAYAESGLVKYPYVTACFLGRV